MAAPRTVRVLLAGDVMTGRGIDQILPRPGDPTLHEPYMRDARGYVELAEDRHRPIPHPVPFDWPWGDALDAMDHAAPDLRIVNLETAITTSDHWDRGKAVHYRMHPANIGVLTAARIDCCGLANNHVLDWGESGLMETLTTLTGAGIPFTGAGQIAALAHAPCILTCRNDIRVLVYAIGVPSSGIPEHWAAATDRPGVNLALADVDATLAAINADLQAHRQPGDRVIVSIHWGPNWGYEVPAAHRQLAHGLIDELDVAVVHGHSSHHAMGIEVHNGRLILYGAGDLLNDYEGISGHEAYRGDLALLYFADLSTDDGRLRALRMVPMRSIQLRLRHATPEDRQWLCARLDRECARHGTGIRDDGCLHLSW